MIVPARFGNFKRRQGCCQAVLSPNRIHQLDFLTQAHLLRPKKFFKRAISTSFLPNNCSRSAIRCSYSATVPFWLKISGPLSNKVCFQLLTVLGWTWYAFATCPGVFVPCNISRTTWNFNLGLYRFAIIFSSLVSIPAFLEEVKFHITI